MTATSLTTAIPLVDITAVGAGDTPLQQIMRLARHHGPIFTRRLHDSDRLFVTSLDLVSELADEQRFTKSVGPALENVREFTADGLFTAYNHEANWAKAHDILMPAFALGSMRAYHPAMLRVARRLIDAWDERLVQGVPVDVPEDMTRMTLDTIGLAGFGYDFESFARPEPHPFVGAMVRCLDWAMNKLGRDPEGDFAAEDAAFREDAAFLAGVVDEVIAARTASGDTRTDDLLGLMLGAPHPSDGTTLDAANIRNQVITFLIAGHETTSGALSFALHHLLKDPVSLRLAQRETDELWGDTENPEPTFEDVGRLRWTRQVLLEALRLWPTAAAFTREAREDTVLGGRYPLRAGEGVTVLTPMLHRDPVWGDNPELFDPTRFDPAVEAARSPHAYKPFGTGERACIGRQFALHEATMLLGMLIHRYRFADTAGYRLRVKETLTLKPDGFTLTLVRRTAADRAVNRAALPASARTEGVRAETGGGSATTPTRARAGTGLLVLHGSNYGTCRELARDLADEAARLGFDASAAPLDERAGELPTDTPVVLVAASYNGRPTDDAARFMEWAERTAGPGAADGVHYAVLGVGDRNWAATYQRVPTLLDERLAALGGTRLLPRAEADASGDLTGAVEGFTRSLLRTLLERHGDPESTGPESTGTAAPQDTDGPAYEVAEVSGGPLTALAERHGMLPMTVTEAYELTDPAHPRTKRFLRLALPEGVSYRTADHLAVLPANDPELVARAAALFGADLDTVLSLRPRRAGRDTLPVDRPLTVRELLTHHLELAQRPTPRQLATLAERNPCPPERTALESLSPDDPRTLLELIEDHPALRGALGAAALPELLSPLRPRTYSISSSPAVDARHADLMVSVLEAPARSGRGVFRGTGSGHLAALRPGDTVLARVQPCREAFRIAADERTPVVMVAAGTGLAPFRGTIADRTALAAAGAEPAPALLYFGCDAPEADFLHSAELRAAEDAGAVSVRPAFSERPEAGGGPYVQHRLAAEGDEVWSLLEAGARVYVCGDGARMAPGVRAALRDLCARRTGADARAADAWLRELTDAGRYVEDVYAAG
ncbi:bifunctional cytochrome P450/NADPH--P450 reductase [Streptomyces hesseae]|uniref:Bifunctional cytochrome P450/NADPH--P450 reductase n=1 Tax=Streptomyces hesseae TaxID=3075519 RepID=A0ABU2SKP6_9ACTN|nr:cytochrome P450 [Streptomyces sp. DSM 40473]MDT0449373.1 cytochrome P450 [Streptomyces sp. DSM 40473]